MNKLTLLALLYMVFCLIVPLTRANYLHSIHYRAHYPNPPSTSKALRYPLLLLRQPKKRLVTLKAIPISCIGLIGRRRLVCAKRDDFPDRLRTVRENVTAADGPGGCI